MTPQQPPLDRDRARTLFSDYLDGELPPSTSEQLKALLDDDPELAKELATFQRTLHSLSALSAPKGGPNLAPKVEKKINRRSRGRFFGPQPMVFRIPFEWISFLIIIALLMLYLTVIQGTGQRVSVNPSSDKGTSSAPKTAKGATPTSRPNTAVSDPGPSIAK